jgi:HlyD family secretion protein
MMRLTVVLFAILLPLTSSAQQWIQAEVADRPVTVAASGIVTSADALRFGPPPSRSWRITLTQLAREGSRVKAGDVLAKFDGSATDDRLRTLRAELNAKRSELESLRETQASEVEDGKVRLASAKSEAEKAARKADTDGTLFASLEYKKLLEEKAITAALLEQEKRRILLVARVRQSKEAELEADIRRLESEMSGAQRELESFTIKAPREGLVIVGTDRQGQKLDVNDAVNPGIVVVELADEKNLVVQAEIPEYAAASIEVGQKADVSVDAVGGSEWPAEVVSVASIVRRQSQYSQAMVRDVTLTLPPELITRLRPGMSAKIEITVDIQQSALAVPEAAIEYMNGKPGVFVRGDGWRPVRLGRAGAGFHIIETGLAEGEEVRL